jgi:putative zinc finger/helix-turn-helix YgiT family protein
MRTRAKAMKDRRSKKGIPEAARRRALADDACPRCGTMMIERRSALRLPINGEDVAVPSAVHLRCPKCDEVVLRFSDSKRLQEDAIATYRKKHGLLSADEIRGIRERFGLTQRELAHLLHDLALGVRPERPDGSDGDAPQTATRSARQSRLPATACRVVGASASSSRVDHDVKGAGRIDSSTGVRATVPASLRSSAGPPGEVRARG